jgi:hypothetical protein
MVDLVGVAFGAHSAVVGAAASLGRMSAAGSTDALRDPLGVDAVILQQARDALVTEQHSSSPHVSTTVSPPGSVACMGTVDSVPSGAVIVALPTFRSCLAESPWSPKAQAANQARCNRSASFAQALHRGPCQKFARDCATRNLAPPHGPTLGSAFHLLGCVGR